MMSRYPIEALLRPIVEFYGAASWLVLSAFALLGQWIFYFTPAVANVTFCIFLTLSYFRFDQGYRVLRYQKGLRRLKHIILPSKKIPCSNNSLFIGYGFEWDQRHTQRLYDTELQHGRKYVLPSDLYKSARALELKLENTPLSFVNNFTSKDAWWNPVAPLPSPEGKPAIHGVGLFEGERPIFYDLSVRVGHTRVLGTTRVGKTRLAELFIAQDIRRGDVVIVFDPKGDPDLFKRMYVEAKQANRLDKLYFFHLGYPEVSARYNPVGNFMRVTEVAARIAGQMPGEGPSQAFREFVWRYVNVIAKGLNALGRKIDFEQIKYYGEDIEPLVIDYLEFLLDKKAKQNQMPKDWRTTVDRYEEGYREREQPFKRSRNQEDRGDRALALVRYCKEHKVDDYVSHSLVKTFEYDKKHFDNLVASLMPLMEKLCTGKCAELISPNYLDIDDSRQIFSWSEVIATGGIVYVGLDALSDPEVASAVGNSMFADLTAIAGRIYKKGPYSGLPDAGGAAPRINIHADEFNELIGDEFIPLLNKAGGAGYQVTAYTQTWSDVLARLQSEAKAGQTAGNFNTTIMLRVQEDDTAKMMTESLKQVPVNHLMTVSAATDSSDPDSNTDFTSKTEDRNTTQMVDLIHINDLKNLPKGHCFATLEGGKLFKLRLPMADKNDFNGIPESVLDITKDMENKYRTSEDWFNYTPSWTEAA